MRSIPGSSIITLIALAGAIHAIDACANDHRTSEAHGWTLQGPGSPLSPGTGAGTKKKLKGYWKPNPHASHTFFAPSAIPMEHGEGYYQNSYVIQHSAWFAPEDHFSIGAGFQMLSIITALRGQGKLPAYFLALKAGARINPDLCVGIFGITQQFTDNPPFSDQASTDYRVSSLCAQVTYGSLNRHITFSGGWGYTALGWTKDPMIGIGGQWRVIEQLAIITENWMLKFGKEPYSIYTLGARFLHRKLGADLGLVYNSHLAETFAPVVPYIGFSLKF